VVQAELNRPLTPAELADWEAEIREEAGLSDKGEEITSHKQKPTHLRLVVDNGRTA
jgi:hypothetical protein